MHKVTQAPSIKTSIFRTCRALVLGISTLVAFTGLSTFTGYALAGDAEITEVNITPAGDNVYQISVTLLHGDTGWDHYANRWDVLDEQGNLLGSRTLAHPHVNEQPFTRSLRVEIPASVTMVTIVASDSVHGDNEKTVTVEVPKE